MKYVIYIFGNVVTYLSEHPSAEFAYVLSEMFQILKHVKISHYPFNLCFVLLTYEGFK